MIDNFNGDKYTTVINKNQIFLKKSAKMLKKMHFC